MPGKPFHGIDLLRLLMKLVNDVSQKVASGGEHAVGHVSSELSFRFGKVSGNSRMETQVTLID